MFISSFIFTTAHAENIQKIRTIEEQQKYSRKEAYRASTDRIILHYGKGIRGVDQITEILIERGYPAVAYPGGPEGLVELFIHRGIVGKYDQDAVDDGELGGHAITIFKERVGSGS